MSQAVLWQRIEAAIVFVSGLVFFWHWNDVTPWWAALLIFFAPDISFLGYLLGPKVGAIFYNIVHVYAFGVGSMAFGLVVASPLLAAWGALWVAHAGFDRMLGYGLKLPEGFASTHLGPIGRRPA